ncbi:DUF2716 domain-containing protein [Lactococcus nasutitermitis]|uniref:DUF2716 domain-containing protein n=1 Tax=Lactococcus nasutitermitis TaxID=1652957 RepID=A0ABV9JDB2_9LACT|nr:DUF2716 domain-containing protein [Lactococcus nasutitermitis]
MFGKIKDEKKLIGKNQVWTILSDEEYKIVWDKIYSDFHFSPSIKISMKTFDFPFQADCYEVDYQKYSQNKSFNDVMRSIFISAMGDDDWMYVLDWQHTCFHWNPRIEDKYDYPVFHKDKRYAGNGYNIYFPEFYPNGDYYFFIAKDFRWGYLGHPWKKKIWVYGTELRKMIKENQQILNFQS